MRSAYHLGRGHIALRGQARFEDVREGRRAIVVTEIPYQVNKSRMLERIAEVVREKLIDGISDLRDESDRHGLRVVIELRREAVPDVVLNQLYRYTPLQTTVGVNMLALIGGRPELMNLKQVIAAFVASARTSSRGAPSTSLARHVSVPTPWSDSPWRWQISIR